MNTPASGSATPDTSLPPTRFTAAGVLHGMRDILPIGLLVIPLAMAFGVAATQQGLDPWLATFMSLLVCGGASQFAAVELWVHPLPVLLILLTTLAINARHLIYGAAIYPWIAPLPPLTRYAVLGVMTDTCWAYGMQSQSRYQHDAGILLGSGVLLWTVWTLATLLGAHLGSGIGNPRTYGLDVVMVTFFATYLVGLWQGRDDLKPWLAAAAGAMLALWLLPSGWHVIVGALAGGLTGLIADES